MSDFVAALGEVLCHVVKDLGAIVSAGLGPASGFVSSFDRIPNVFAISERYFTEHLSVLAAHLHAVARIRSRLFAPDVKFYSAIDLGRIEGGACGLLLAIRIFGSRIRGRQGRCMFEPGRLKIFKQTCLSPFAAVSA